MQRIQGSFLRLVTKASEDNVLPRHLLSQFPLQYSASRAQAQPQPVSAVKPFSVVRVELEMVRPWEWGAQPLYSSSSAGSCKDAFGRCAMAGSQPFANTMQERASPLLPMLWLAPHIMSCIHTSWRGKAADFIWLQWWQLEFSIVRGVNTLGKA